MDVETTACFTLARGGCLNLARGGCWALALGGGGAVQPRLGAQRDLRVQQVGGGHCRAPTPAKGAACTDFLRSSCASDSFIQRNAVQYTISHQFTDAFKTLNLTNFEMDLAIFLASRGNYSWLGYGWMGCGCGWSDGAQMACDLYQRPAALDLDCKLTSYASYVCITHAS